MACRNCKDCKDHVMHVCRVCELLDGNVKVKRCCYCDFCAAYICKDCHSQWKKRVLAAFADKVIEPIAEVIKKIAGRKRTPKNIPDETQIIPAPDTEDTA